jgi:hypothetical protein
LTLLPETRDERVFHVEREYLYDVLPPDFPMDGYCNSDYRKGKTYRDWERTVHLYLITVKGWKAIQFNTLEADSFGPLARGMTCYDENDRVRNFFYG